MTKSIRIQKSGTFKGLPLYSAKCLKCTMPLNVRGIVKDAAIALGTDHLAKAHGVTV